MNNGDNSKRLKIGEGVEVQGVEVQGVEVQGAVQEGEGEREEYKRDEKLKKRQATEQERQRLKEQRQEDADLTEAIRLQKYTDYSADYSIDDNIIVSGLFKNLPDETYYDELIDKDKSFFSHLTPSSDTKVLYFQGHGTTPLGFKTDIKPNIHGTVTVKIENSNIPKASSNQYIPNFIIVPPNVVIVNTAPFGAVSDANGNLANAILNSILDNKEDIIELIKTGKINDIFEYENFQNTRPVKSQYMKPTISSPGCIVPNVQLNIISDPDKPIWASGFVDVDLVKANPRLSRAFNNDRVEMATITKTSAAPFLNITESGLQFLETNFNREFLDIIDGEVETDRDGKNKWSGSGNFYLQELLDLLFKMYPEKKIVLFLDCCYPLDTTQIKKQSDGTKTAVYVSEKVEKDLDILHDSGLSSIEQKLLSYPIDELQYFKKETIPTYYIYRNRRLYNITYNPVHIILFKELQKLLDKNYAFYLDCVEGNIGSRRATMPPIKILISATESVIQELEDDDAFTSDTQPLDLDYLTGLQPSVTAASVTAASVTAASETSQILNNVDGYLDRIHKIFSLCQSAASTIFQRQSRYSCIGHNAVLIGPGRSDEDDEIHFYPIPSRSSSSSSSSSSFRPTGAGAYDDSRAGTYGGRTIKTRKSSKSRKTRKMKKNRTRKMKKNRTRKPRKTRQ